MLGSPWTLTIEFLVILELPPLVHISQLENLISLHTEVGFSSLKHGCARLFKEYKILLASKKMDYLMAEMTCTAQILKSVLYPARLWVYGNENQRCWVGSDFLQIN